MLYVVNVVDCRCCRCCKMQMLKVVDVVDCRPCRRCRLLMLQMLTNRSGESDKESLGLTTMNRNSLVSDNGSILYCRACSAELVVDTSDVFTFPSNIRYISNRSSFLLNIYIFSQSSSTFQSLYTLFNDNIFRDVFTRLSLFYECNIVFNSVHIFTSYNTYASFPTHPVVLVGYRLLNAIAWLE